MNNGEDEVWCKVTKEIWGQKAEKGRSLNKSAMKTSRRGQNVGFARHRCRNTVAANYLMAVILLNPSSKGGLIPWGRRTSDTEQATICLLSLLL